MLPKGFVENALDLCGARGCEWIESIPATIKALENDWDFTSDGHFHNLSFNYVGRAIRNDGTRAVLKIALPLDDPEIYGEAEYLRISEGRGVAKLLEYSDEHRAMLIESVEPGTPLKTRFRRDQSKAVTIAAELLCRVSQPAPNSEFEFTRLDDWFSGLERAIQTKFPQDFVGRALEYYSQISSDRSQLCLIHGDLHHTNILAATREPFLLIDPKGIIGHLGYDIGVFLNNHHNWLEWDQSLEPKLDAAVATFAATCGLDEIIVRKWAFCQMVVSWWWMFDEMPNTYGRKLGLSEIWKV